MRNETIKGLARGAVIVAAGIGLAHASDKTGVTDSIMTYDWVSKAVYHELHERHPLMFWSDYGNPGTIEEYMASSHNRTTANIVAGIGGLVNLGALTVGIGTILDDRRRNKLITSE